MVFADTEQKCHAIDCLESKETLSVACMERASDSRSDVHHADPKNSNRQPGNQTFSLSFSEGCESAERALRGGSRLLHDPQAQQASVPSPLTAKNVCLNYILSCLHKLFDSCIR